MEKFEDEKLPQTSLGQPKAVRSKVQNDRAQTQNICHKYPTILLNR